MKTFFRALGRTVFPMGVKHALITLVGLCAFLLVVLILVSLFIGIIELITFVATWFVGPLDPVMVGNFTLGIFYGFLILVAVSTFIVKPFLKNFKDNYKAIKTKEY